MQSTLNGHWDICIIGNGISALWAAHWNWTQKKSVLWISSEEPYSPGRGMLGRGWLWGTTSESFERIASALRGLSLESSEQNQLVYFDAKGSKRFRPLKEAKFDWGTHESEYFESVAQDAGTGFSDLWALEERLHGFHGGHQSAGDTAPGPQCMELFHEPRLVRVQAWPIAEIVVEENRVAGVKLASLKGGEGELLRADQFILCDFEEPLSNFIKDEKAGAPLSAYYKGRTYAAGFGLKLWHKELDGALTQPVIVPLTVSPEKGKASHLLGRFVRNPDTNQVVSYWVGLLTDEEVEDNNEILKKIKQSKRAVDRAIPGFSESVARESVSFEPKMRMRRFGVEAGSELPVQGILGAQIATDYYGPRGLESLFEGTVEDVAAAQDENAHLR